MKNFLIELFASIIATIISWVITIGIIKLITLCFSIPFALIPATGIWLILFLLKRFFIEDKK